MIIYFAVKNFWTLSVEASHVEFGVEVRKERERFELLDIIREARELGESQLARNHPRYRFASPNFFFFFFSARFRLANFSHISKTCLTLKENSVTSGNYIEFPAIPKIINTISS